MRLALGTVQFGLTYGVANQQGQPTASIVKAILRLAKEKNIDLLDTAISYGESEERLGKIGVNEFRVVTKLPSVPNSVNNIDSWVNEQITGSLSRLCERRIYGLLLHRPKELLAENGEAIFQSLQQLKSSGVIQKIGVSVYSPDELAILLSNFDLDLVQFPLNLVDRRFAKSGWIDRLKKKGIEIHTRSVFLQGLLLMPRQKIPLKFAPWIELIEKWHQWLEYNNITAIQAALAYPLSFQEVDNILVGVDNPDQLDQVVKSMGYVLNDNLPDISLDDGPLINPAKWAQL